MKILFILRLYYSLLMSIQCVEIRLALFFFFLVFHSHMNRLERPFLIKPTVIYIIQGIMNKINSNSFNVLHRIHFRIAWCAFHKQRHQYQAIVLVVVVVSNKKADVYSKQFSTCFFFVCSQMSLIEVFQNWISYRNVHNIPNYWLLLFFTLYSFQFLDFGQDCTLNIFTI